MLYHLYNLKLKTLFLFVIVYVFVHLIFKVFIFNTSDEDARSLPILTWWTQFTGIKNDRVISCSNGAHKCLITTNVNNARLSAYLFYGSHIENHNFPLPRNYTVRWALFHEESPKNYGPLLYTGTQNLFNVTSTFSRYSDFPITLQYLEDVTLLKDLKYYKPIGVKNKYLNEEDIAPILYIQSNCDTPLSRDYIVNELGKFVKIDCYGTCLNNKSLPKEFSEIDPLDIYNDEMLRFIARYKFIIGFENSICDDYITEKLWRPLIVGSIPIYLGAPTVEDWLPNKNSAILVKNYKSIKELAERIINISTNDDLYQSFLEHKLKSKISNPLLEKNILNENPLPAFECFVCNQIHQDSNVTKRDKRSSVYNCPKPNASDETNTWHQHWDVSKCQSKALEMLIRKNKIYSSALFEDTWQAFFYNKDC